MPYRQSNNIPACCALKQIHTLNITGNHFLQIDNV